MGLRIPEGLLLSNRVSFALGYWSTPRTREEDARVRAIIEARVEAAARQLAAERGSAIEVYASSPKRRWLAYTVLPQGSPGLD